MIKRLYENDLSLWYARSQRKPLLVRGARQVGKSTLVRKFAMDRGLTLNEVNLEKHVELETVFRSLDALSIRQELGVLCKKDILQPSSLLFLDEIQATPSAIPALRYVQEAFPELPIIAAGSLLEFILAEHDFSMPVGRIEYLQMGPLTFQEFLTALGDAYLLSEMKGYTVDSVFAGTAHKKLLQRQREYLCIGGMPEVVAAFSEKQDFTEISVLQDTILSTYQDDFPKYGKRINPLQLKLIFQQIPQHIGKKIKYSKIQKDEKARDVRRTIHLLTQARVVTPVFHSSCSGIPLLAGADPDVYKLLFLDIGLMNRFLGVDWVRIRSLDDVHLVNEGPLAEQFIGQHLLQMQDTHVQTPKVVYWLREGKSTNAEIDFVISRGGELIVPIEVKAGKAGSLKSVHQFILEKKSPLAVRFDLNLPKFHTVHSHSATREDVKDVHFHLLSLPLYLVEELPRLLDEIRSKNILDRK